VCIGVPGQIIEVRSDSAIVELGGLKREVGTQLVDDLKPGDYVLVHAGYAIQKIDEEDAQETLALLNEMYSHFEEGPEGASSG